MQRFFGSIPRTTVNVCGELDISDDPQPAAIASVFGSRRVSIRSKEQEGMGDQARLTFITHRAVEADLQATLADLADLDVVKNILQVLRVIST